MAHKRCAADPQRMHRAVHCLTSLGLCLRQRLTGSCISHSVPNTVRQRHGNVRVQGRYSFVGAQPALEVVARGHSVTVIDHSTRQRTTTEEDDPMKVGKRLSLLYLHAGLLACRLPAAGGAAHASHLAWPPTVFRAQAQAAASQ